MKLTRKTTSGGTHQIGDASITVSVCDEPDHSSEVSVPLPSQE
jgi:hypothetical protein